MKYLVMCKESYDVIEYCNSIKEGWQLVEQYEQQDMAEGIYTCDFYTVGIEDAEGVRVEVDSM